MELERFKRVFDSRHDFNDSDLCVLRNKFPRVKIKNIPTAWILLIDDMLQKCNKDISGVDQYFGQLVISFNVTADQDSIQSTKKIVDKTEEKIREIDKDLHKTHGFM